MFLVTGANGQLGSELRKTLGNSAVYVDKHILDITDEMAVKNYLSSTSFECIINCAAYTAVDKAEDEYEQSDAVNRLGPTWLAKYGKFIVHISTDYVFDGKSYLPYCETDQPNPLSVYGKTKLEGEKAVLENAETAIIIRTGWLYSSSGNNFLKTMLHLGKTRDSINVVFDQIGSPTNARDLAKTITEILPQVTKNSKSIYHFTNEGVCSWYDFAHAIMQMARLSCKVNPITSENYPTKAQRPHYSLLDKSKIKHDYRLKIKHWHDALRIFMEEEQEQLGLDFLKNNEQI